MMRLSVGVCAGLVAFVATAPAQGALVTAFDTLGPGNLWSTSASAWTISGRNSIVGLDISQGDAFTPTVGGPLMRIELGFMSQSGSSFSLRLYEDTPNGGPLIWSGSASNSNMAPVGSVGDVTVVEIDNGPVLDTTTQYWLIASATGSNNFGWGFNVLGFNGLHAQRTDTSDPYSIFTPTGFLGQATGAFRITVPGPGALALFAVAAAARRRRRA